MERTYRIHMAAEMSGVSEGLIRAWERRYGVLKPRRTASGYRNYTEADIEVLRRLKKLTEEGVAIAEAVRLLPQLRREAKEFVEAREGPRKAPQAEQVARWRQEVLVAAERLDQQTVEAILDEAMASLPPVAFFEELLVPLQREVGERWHSGSLTVAEEHLVTQAARQRVLTLLHQAPRRARRHVVCACLPLEDHELGLMGAALRFRHAGWRVTFLGARTPAEHLGRVVRAVQPDLVALSAVGTDEREPLGKTLAAIAERLPKGTRVVVGGPAASAHPEAVRGLEGFEIVDDDGWDALLA
jgi:DNA-binding transcriptional MerR regulator/methylmalonyl-CoA mutase cobalamin-binding subunit